MLVPEMLYDKERVDYV